MILPRREFLRLLGVSAGTVGWAGCRGDWLVPDRLVERALAGPGLESWKQSVCGLCEGGCGMSVRLVDGLPVGVKGNPRHPLNRGGLCPVGQGALEVLYAPGRLTGPTRRGAGGELEPVSWDEAMAEIVERLAALVNNGESHKIAIVSGEQGELFDDLLERFARSLGTANVARLGRPSTLPFYLTQGLDRVPGFDFAHADLVFSFGLDLFAEGTTPLHAVSSLIGERPTNQRATLLHVGTRLSPGIARADRRVAVRPGTHGAFALGVANVLVREGRYDHDFVAEHTAGFDDWIDSDGNRRLGFRRLLLERYYPDRAARMCGVSPGLIVDLARRFAEGRAPLAVVGGEAAAGSNATWTVMAVHSLNALMGAFGKEGGVILPPAIPLALLEPLPQPASPSIFAADTAAAPFGADPVDALAQAASSGALEAVILIGSNPIHDSPAGGRLGEVLRQVPTSVAMAPFADETAAASGYQLPSPTFVESWQAVSTPPGTALATLGLSPPAVERLYDSRHSGDVLLRLAKELGGESALPWSDYAGYLRFRTAGISVSGAGALLSGSLEESWVRFLEERGWRFQAAGTGGDFWRELGERAGWWNPARSLGDWSQLFRTPSGRFEFFSGALDWRLRELGSVAQESSSPARDAAHRGAVRLGLEATDDEASMPHFETPRTAGAGDLLLVPYRSLTARGQLSPVSPMVMEMFDYPSMSGWETPVEIAAEAAHELDLHDGDLVRVESDRDGFEAVVRVQVGTRPDVALVPLGMGHPAQFGSGGGVGANPMRVTLPITDSLAGTMATAGTRVRLRLVRRRLRGGRAPVHGGEV